MKIVIQCAGSKNSSAGHFMTTAGRRIEFVAQPDAAPQSNEILYARPDDWSDQHGRSWRDLISDYNAHPRNNPFGLFPAYLLYSNDAYRVLVRRFGSENVYILSAGWGLIRSDFLTPWYDITFKHDADAYKRRGRNDKYSDFCHLTDPNEEVLFFGGKDYLPLFCQLTQSVRAPRIVFYNSRITPSAPGCVLKRYETSMRTNWHYACGRDFAEGKINAAD